MIPEDWKKKPLSQVAAIQTGIAKGAKQIREPVRLPYLRVANVQDGYLDLSHVKTIEIDRTKVERYRLKIGDVLLTEGGDFDKLGRGTIWNGEIEECVHQNHIFVARPDPNVILPRFLSLLTGSPYGKAYFKKCSKQSTNLASINSTQLKGFPVLIPPLCEQTAIADLLSTWDASIEKTGKLIAAKEKRFSWLRAQLLFPDKHWKPEKLAAICSIKKGKQLSKVDMIEDGEYYVLNGGISPSGFTDKWNTPGNTITISEGGNSCGFVSFNKEPFWSGGHCYSLTELSQDFEPFFLYHFLKRHEHKIMRLRVGSGLPNIQRKDIENIHISFPGLLEQRQIAETLNAAFQEIDLLCDLVDALHRQKRGLMQKLLTGIWKTTPGNVAHTKGINQ